MALPLLRYMGAFIILGPAALFAVLGLCALLHRQLSERTTAWLTHIVVVTGLAATIGMLVIMLVNGPSHLSVSFGNWASIPEQHFHFHLKFVFDWLSVPFLLLTYLLVGIVGAFANRYMQWDSGYHRFFLFYAMFLLGMIVATAAGTIETLFSGWELVGLSSALLVAFFQDRIGPVRNGIRIWTIYRLADAFFLFAALVLHHATGEGDLESLLGNASWPAGQAVLAPTSAFWIGLLLLAAAAGKSALVPFSGWLPRAMEGPTPSSAIFYGALSVHLGAFLLLRMSPLLEQSAALCVIISIVGVTTAILAAFAARVQTDAKSALAFAALIQVGIIITEIGMGFRFLALAHMIGHACLRTLQLLRAPSLLRDYRTLENAIGVRLSHSNRNERSWLPERQAMWLWRFGTERCYLDALLDDYLARPFLKFFMYCDRLERRCREWFAGSSRTQVRDELPHSELFGVRRNGAKNGATKRRLTTVGTKEFSR